MNVKNNSVQIVYLLIIVNIFIGKPIAMNNQQTSAKLSFFAGSVAGSGNIDGQGKMARFTYPGVIAMSPSGALFVTGNKESHNISPTRVIRKISSSGEVTTFAGTLGVAGSADGQSTQAQFNQPAGIAINNSGNIFVTDQANHNIRKITPDGMVSTLAGKAGSKGSDNGVNENARFNSPSAIAIDSQNNLYVVDSFNHTIRKITPNGNVSTFAGEIGTYGLKDGKGEKANFEFPSGIVIDKNDNLYISESKSIRKITRDGQVTTLKHFTAIDEHGEKVAAEFFGIDGISMDSQNNFYITEQATVVRKINADGLVTTLAGSDLGLYHSIGNNDGKGEKAKFDHPTGLVVGKDNQVWVCDTDNHTIRRISADGIVTTFAGDSVKGHKDDGVGSTARFNDPNLITADSHGNLYVDVRFGHLRKITPEASVTTLDRGTWNQVNKPEDSATYAESFTGISGLATDDKNNVYLSSSLSRQHSGGGGYSMVPNFLRKKRYDQILAISQSAKISKIAGKKPALNFPAGLTIDKQGFIYAAMKLDHTIVKIKPRSLFSPKIEIIAGKAEKSGSSDGSKSEALFNQPLDIVMDSKQNLFVADSGNHTIRKIEPNGKVSTFAGKAREKSYVDGDPSQSRLSNPGSLTIDSNDNLYLVDTDNHTIRKITPKGITTTFVGQVGKIGFIPGELPGVIPYPKSVVVHDDSLYIVVSSGVVVVRNLSKEI